MPAPIATICGEAHSLPESLDVSLLTHFTGSFYRTSDGLRIENVSQDLGVDSGGLPLPAALPLFATGLGALGLLGWRRKRKALAA